MSEVYHKNLKENFTKNRLKLVLMVFNISQVIDVI